MHTVTDFHDLWDAVQPFRGGRWIYRGVADAEFALVPKLGRLPAFHQHERRILDHFVREAAAYEEGKAGSNVWEQLAVAQHYGLPTRLLDWTENPLVAAFFACSQYADRDGALYCASITRRIDTASESPFSLEAVGRYRPRHTSRRIGAQRGLFTVHCNPTQPLEDEGSSGLQVHKVLITAEAKAQLIWDLSRVNVNHASLFPDLAGLATNIAWTYATYDPSKAPDERAKT